MLFKFNNKTIKRFRGIHLDIEVKLCNIKVITYCTSNIYIINGLITYYTYNIM